VTPWLVAIASGALGVVAALWQTVRLERERRAHQLLIMDTEYWSEKNLAKFESLTSANAGAEEIVRQLKAEISELQGDLDACTVSDPAAVRDRLRRLLEGATRPAAAARVSHGTTAGDGAGPGGGA